MGFHWQEASVTEQSAGHLDSSITRKIRANSSNLSHKWRNMPEGIPVRDACIPCCTKDLPVCWGQIWLQELTGPATLELNSMYIMDAPVWMMRAWRWVEPVTTSRAKMPCSFIRHTAQSCPGARNVSATPTTGATWPYHLWSRPELSTYHQRWVETKRRMGKMQQFTLLVSNSSVGLGSRSLESVVSVLSDYLWF